jgi:NAD+ synthase (glutamine-hydrolysing)
MRRRCYSGAEVVANLSASPYRVGFAGTRREMLATRSGDNEATLVYSNAVGAQDGLIFDGGGWIFQNGRLALEAERFREGWTATIVDLDRTRRIRQENTTWRTDCEAFQLAGGRVATIDVRGGAQTADRSKLTYPAPRGGSFFLPANPERVSNLSPREEMLDELYEALALGVKDYWQKTGAFNGLGIALSGGRDSMLTLAIAWRAAALAARAANHGAELRGDALRAKIGETIAAFYMPSRFSAETTQGAAATFAEELGVPLLVVPIEEAFEREVEATRAMLGGGEPNEITRQNVQARIRAARMWNWSNSAGRLFLQTGDMSEKAVGYTTIGGDLEGALSVIANVPKTVVVAMLERLHARFGWKGIAATLATAPGPELAAAQEAENELMPFPVLDTCLHLYAGEKLSASEVARALPSLFPEIPTERLSAWAQRFAVLFTRSIYKWVQAPLSLHVGSLDLDRERALQLPVVQKTEWDGDR